MTDVPVDRKVIEQLLMAANMAPSHRKTEPWRFRVYTGAGRETLAHTIETIYTTGRTPDQIDPKVGPKFRKKTEQAPVIIAIFLHRDPKESVPEWEEIAAVGCAVENLWISLSQHNLGGYWSSPGFLCGDYGQWPEAAANERCLGLFYLGHHDMPELPQVRGEWAEKVKWV